MNIRGEEPECRVGRLGEFWWGSVPVLVLYQCATAWCSPGLPGCKVMNEGMGEVGRRHSVTVGSGEGGGMEGERRDRM